jgi:DNA modification methylase
VLDPLLGLGHTAVACAQLGLPCDGFEIDSTYLEEAVARVAEALRPRPVQGKLV